MIDRLFLATLTFCVLIAGTLAIGSAMFQTPHRAVAVPVRIVQLERVVITTKRPAPVTDVAQTDAATPVTQRVQ